MVCWVDAECQWGPTMGSQHIDAAAVVHAIRRRGSTRHPAGYRLHRAGCAVVRRAWMTSSPRSFQTRTRSPSLISLSSCIQRVDEDPLRERPPAASHCWHVWNGRGQGCDARWLAADMFAAVFPVTGVSLSSVVNGLSHSGMYLGTAGISSGLPRSYRVLEKISIFPLGVFNGYFCGSRRKSAKAIAGWVTGFE